MAKCCLLRTRDNYARPTRRGTVLWEEGWCWQRSRHLVHYPARSKKDPQLSKGLLATGRRLGPQATETESPSARSSTIILLHPSLNTIPAGFSSERLLALQESTALGCLLSADRTAAYNTHLVWMYRESVPSPLAAPPLQMSSDVRRWSRCVRGDRRERASERAGRQEATGGDRTQRGHMRSATADTLLVYTVAPKLLHYNPASVSLSLSTAVTWMWTQTGCSAPWWVTVILQVHMWRLPLEHRGSSWYLWGMYNMLNSLIVLLHY